MEREVYIRIRGIFDLLYRRSKWHETSNTTLLCTCSSAWKWCSRSCLWYFKLGYTKKCLY